MRLSFLALVVSLVVLAVAADAWLATWRPLAARPLGRTVDLLAEPARYGAAPASSTPSQAQQTSFPVAVGDPLGDTSSLRARAISALYQRGTAALRSDAGVAAGALSPAWTVKRVVGSFSAAQHRAAWVALGVGALLFVLAAGLASARLAEYDEWAWGGGALLVAGTMVLAGTAAARVLVWAVGSGRASSPFWDVWAAELWLPLLTGAVLALAGVVGTAWALRGARGR